MRIALEDNAAVHVDFCDNRYSAGREFTGRAAPEWVVRFCGEWIGRADSRKAAEEMAAAHAAQRRT
jgi:plasmid replication initiation protein